MNSKGFSTLNQHKIEKFINELLVDKVKIIFGPQHAGIEPIYHCSVILEAGLKVYLKKIDPQQNISRWGLGKLYGRSLEKDTFPKRFKIPIGRLNTIWIEKKHNVEKTGDISVDEIRKLTSDFIIWLFTKVLKQKMENDLSQIIFQGVKNEIIIESIKEKTISGKKKSTNSGRNNVLEDAYKKLRNIKKSDASTLISKSELEKVNLHIVFGSSFKRTY